jgi:hypothetical protein
MLAIAIPPSPVVHRHKRGRPRKLNVRRSPTGKSLGENPPDLTLMFNQPHRRGQSDPASHLHGYALGRLYKRGLISEEQFGAGEKWAAVVSQYRRQLLSAPPVSTRSGEMAERVSSGFAPLELVAEDVDPEQAERDRQNLKKRYDDCFETLMELGRVLNRGRAIINVLRKICIEDRDITENEVGDLRLGLNSLARKLFEK